MPPGVLYAIGPLPQAVAGPGCRECRVELLQQCCYFMSMQTRFDRQERLYQAIRLTRRIDLDVGRVMQPELERNGLTAARRTLLEALVQGGPACVPELAEKLALKRQFVQRVAAELIRAELAEILPNPRHRRSYLCRATEKGRALFDAVHQRELELIRRHLGDINTTEIIVALRVLNRVADCFSGMAGTREGS